MMNKLKIPFILVIALLMLVACNPDCETYTNVASEVSPTFRLPGSEIMIKTNPVNFLENRDVFIQKRSSGESELERMSSFFVNNTGRVAQLPDEVTDTQTIFIEDDDCGGFIPLSSVNVRTEEWFASNLDFITPPPPTIVIPQITVTPPVNVVNAWFSPNDPNYCIWFAPDVEREANGDWKLDADGNPIETSILIPGDLDLLPPDPVTGRSSFELSASCPDRPSKSDLYHVNPVSGIVDKANNIIQIQIDRTSKGLGIEEFSGEFIEPGDLLEEYSIAAPCGSGKVQKQHFMILTSKKTGQQLLLFQN